MKRLGTTLAAGIALCASLLLPTTALAASNSLGVNPRRDYTVKAGETVNDTIFLRNLSKTDDLNLNVELVDFQAQNATGSPALLLKATQPTRWSLKSFLSIQNSVKVAAGQSTEIPFKISMPANVGPGSYYSAIRYSAVGTGGGNLSLSSSSTTLVFVRVPGQANDSLQMTHFGAFTPNSDATSGVYASFFSATAPKYLAYELKNAGNVAEQPSGSILIKDTFGKQVKLYQNANPNNNLVLINQSRRIDFCLNPQQTSKATKDGQAQVEQCDDFGLKPGRYTADLDLVYGTNGSSSREIKATASFWYLPVWFIVAVLVVLLVIAGIIWLVVNAVRNARSRNYRSR